MANLLSQLIAQERRIASFEHLQIDMTGARLAYNLSITDWRDWLPYAVAPFPDFSLSYAPSDYLPESVVRHDTSSDAVALCADDVLQVRIGFPKALRSALKSAIRKDEFDIAGPWVAGFNDPLVLEPNVQSDHWTEFQRLAWSRSYVDKFGLPDIGPVVALNNSYSEFPGHVITKLAAECEGQLRFVLGVLALIGIQRAKHTGEPARRDGRTVHAGRTIPNYRPRLVVLRPDAPRTPSEAREEESGIRKRDHSVRGHVRRYRSGKLAFVRPHRRGDPELGTVQKSYIIEADPNKTLREAQDGQEGI